MTRRSAIPRRSLLKVVAMLGLATTLASIGIAGCHDTVPVEPKLTAPQEAALATYPTKEQFAAMPSEFRQTAQILDYWVDAGFAGGRAYGSAGMRYLANYGKITVPVTLLYNNAEVTSTTALSEKTHFLPAVRNLDAMATLATNGSCGHTVNANALFEVHNQFLLSKSWLIWGRTGISGSDSDKQPACSCSGTIKLTNAKYDPYSTGQGDGDCDSGGSDGSGTQYQPGDYTGGETVSWSTGAGNGGVSLCGDDAMVDYVCIDYWDAGRQRWVQWGCGYVTTCGYAT